MKAWMNATKETKAMLIKRKPPLVAVKDSGNPNSYNRNLDEGRIKREKKE